MKKIISFGLLMFLLAGIQPALAEDTQPGQVEISFDYNRADRDYANNQFAVWIEDLDGNLLKTLFVTKFMATKGWKVRKEALPTWKEKSNISQLEKDEVDAIAGATPLAQQLTFTWAVEAGNSPASTYRVYKYFVECNYYWENTVLYSGEIRVGDNKNTSEAVAQFSTESARDYSIIENVTAEFIPLQ